MASVPVPRCGICAHAPQPESCREQFFRRHQQRRCVDGCSWVAALDRTLTISGLTFFGGWGDNVGRIADLHTLAASFGRRLVLQVPSGTSAYIPSDIFALNGTVSWGVSGMQMETSASLANLDSSDLVHAISPALRARVANISSLKARLALLASNSTLTHVAASVISGQLSRLAALRHLHLQLEWPSGGPGGVGSRVQGPDEHRLLPASLVFALGAGPLVYACKLQAPALRRCVAMLATMPLEGSAFARDVVAVRSRLTKPYAALHIRTGAADMRLPVPWTGAADMRLPVPWTGAADVHLPVPWTPRRYPVPWTGAADVHLPPSAAGGARPPVPWTGAARPRPRGGGSSGSGPGSRVQGTVVGSGGSGPGSRVQGTGGSSGSASSGGSLGGADTLVPWLQWLGGWAGAPHTEPSASSASRAHPGALDARALRQRLAAEARGWMDPGPWTLDPHLDPGPLTMDHGPWTMDPGLRRRLAETCDAAPPGWALYVISDSSAAVALVQRACKVSK